MMLVLVLSSLLRPPDIAGAGRRLLSSNDRQSDITRNLVPCPGLVPTQGIQMGLGMIRLRNFSEKLMTIKIMLVLVISSLLCSPEIAGAGQ